MRTLLNHEISTISGAGDFEDTLCTGLLWGASVGACIGGLLGFAIQEDMKWLLGGISMGLIGGAFLGVEAAALGHLFNDMIEKDKAAGNHHHFMFFCAHMNNLIAR